MEIGIAGWAFHRAILADRTMTLLEFPAVARQDFGVGVVELVSEFFESQTAAYLNQLRQALRKERLRVHSIAVDQGHIASPDEAVRRTGLEALKQWFFVARAIGAGAIRVNTDDFEPLVRMIVTRRPIPADAIRFNWARLSAQERQDTLERIVAGYRELADMAAQSQVKLLLENHGGVTGVPANIAQILSRVDTPWFATCPDNHNPYEDDAWEEGTRVLAPRAYSAHVKLAGYDPSGAQAFVARDGSVHPTDLKRFIAILDQAGYRGPLSLEYNFAESDEREGLRKGLAYLRGFLASSR